MCYFLPLGKKPKGYCDDHRVCVCVCQHFTLFALQVAIQVGSLPNLVWWMVMDQWCDLLFGDTVQWPQPFWSTDFKLKYDIFLYFSHWRLQFKLDLNQTWYDEWTLVSDHLYCFVSRSSDHSRSGPLVFFIEDRVWHSIAHLDMM